MARRVSRATRRRYLVRTYWTGSTDGTTQHSPAPAAHYPTGDGSVVLPKSRMGSRQQCVISQIGGLTMNVTRLALIVVLLAGCAAPRTIVSRDTYPAWPFIPASGELRCEEGSASAAGRQYVSIEFAGHGGIWYALNGSARDAGLPELDSTVWNGDRPATLGLIDIGLRLC